MQAHGKNESTYYHISSTLRFHWFVSNYNLIENSYIKISLSVLEILNANDQSAMDWSLCVYLAQVYRYRKFWCYEMVRCSGKVGEKYALLQFLFTIPQTMATIIIWYPVWALSSLKFVQG